MQGFNAHDPLDTYLVTTTIDVHQDKLVVSQSSSNFYREITPFTVQKIKEACIPITNNIIFSRGTLPASLEFTRDADKYFAVEFQHTKFKDGCETFFRGFEALIFTECFPKTINEKGKFIELNLSFPDDFTQEHVDILRECSRQKCIVHLDIHSISEKHCRELWRDSANHVTIAPQYLIKSDYASVAELVDVINNERKILALLCKSKGALAAFLAQSGDMYMVWRVYMFLKP